MVTPFSQILRKSRNLDYLDQARDPGPPMSSATRLTLLARVCGDDQHAWEMTGDRWHENRGLSPISEVGNRTRQTDALGRVTRWTYDALGRIQSRILPLGQTETFEYDSAGRPAAHTDFNGQTTTFVYDRRGRETERSFADGSAVQTTYTATGQIASQSDAQGSTDYQYDDMDRLTRISYPSGQQIEYSHDAKGNRVSLVSGNHRVTYTYDILDRLETVTDALGTTRYAYDAVGNRAAITYPNGITTEYRYDPLNRLTNQTSRDVMGISLLGFHYDLGPSGNRIRLTELSGRVSDYQYDPLYRLTRETINDPAQTSKDTHYSYDAVGNRLSQTRDGIVTDYRYDANDQLLTETTLGQATSYRYDANGNQTAKTSPVGRTNYQFDQANHLVGMDDGTHTASYRYDANGIRTAKTEDGQITYYLIDPNGDYSQVIGEYGMGGAELARYTYGDDLTAQSNAQGTRYYLYDGLGSSRALAGPSGQVTDEYSYTAFGELTHSQGNYDNRYLFAGEQFDWGLGLYYLRARYMAPSLGRFVALDEWDGRICEPITLNKYAYANLDPIGNVDPSGLFGLGLSDLMGALGVSNIISSLRVASIQSAKKKDRKVIIRTLACNLGVAYVKKQYIGDGLQGHHPISRSFGGPDDQELIFLPANTHRMFHMVLHYVLMEEPELKGLGNWTSARDWEKITQTRAGRRLLYKQILVASRVVDKFCKLKKPNTLFQFVRKNRKAFLGEE